VYNLVELSENDKSIVLGDDYDYEKKCTRTLVLDNESTTLILSMAKTDYVEQLINRYFNISDDSLYNGGARVTLGGTFSIDNMWFRHLKLTKGLASCMIIVKGGWV
jgi:hypothetical protein